MTALSPEGIPPTDEPLTYEELALATRNRGMPLEALRYDRTPTGLHYLLVHYDIPFVEPRGWRLEIDGEVENPVALTMDQLRWMPARTMRVTMECAGNGRAMMSPRPVSQPWLSEAIGTADWTGVALRHVLAGAGLRPKAKHLVFTGADHGTERGVEQDYQRGMSLEDAMREDVMLAYAMNGEPLQPQHGFPLRLVVPGWYGMASVKWLVRIEAVTKRFDGYQHHAYRIRSSSEDEGKELSRIKVRSLMVPPGFPDFLTRRRMVDAGRVELLGRAWAGGTPIAKVEVGIDGEWHEAKVERASGAFAWSGWSYVWDATPGDYDISCRATDAKGDTQPLEQAWNYGGFANNVVQRVAVTVR